MAHNDHKTATVKSAATAFEVLETLKNVDGAGVTELANTLGCSKSTVHRHLKTLYQYEFVIRDGNTYRVSLRFLEFGQHARTRRRAYRMVEPKVVELADETAERAQFIVEEHGRAVYVHHAAGNSAVRTPESGVGMRICLHATAAGKAILAFLPAERRLEIVEQRGLPALTAHTITEPDELLAALSDVRERGYSLNEEENIEGLHAVGVPVLDRDGHVIGAISVSGPSHRIQGERLTRDIPDLLQGVASELRLNLRYL